MTVSDIASEHVMESDDTPVRGDQPYLVPILPLKDTVVYPLTIVPLAVGQERSLRLVDDVATKDRLIGLVAQRNPETQLAGPTKCTRSEPSARSINC